MQGRFRERNPSIRRTLISTGSTTARRAAGTTTRTTLLIVWTTPARRTRGTDTVERLHLIGRQNLGQFGLGIFLQLLELLHLIVGEVELLHGKPGKQMVAGRRGSTTWTSALPSTRPARAALSTITAGSTASRSTTLGLIAARRVLCQGPHASGDRDHCNNQKHQKWKTPHG
jgi:hypothetical protein